MTDKIIQFPTQAAFPVRSGLCRISTHRVPENDNNALALVESAQFKSLVEGNGTAARISVKTAIINATGQNQQPLVEADRSAGIIHNPERRLRMRDLLSVGRTSSNTVEFAKENVFTNNAGPQVGGSPEQFENVTKPESGITFTLSSKAVTTLRTGYRHLSRCWQTRPRCRTMSTAA